MKVSAQELLKPILNIIRIIGGWGENRRQKLVFFVLVGQGVILMLISQSLTLYYAPTIDLAMAHMAYPFQYVTTTIKVWWFYTYRRDIAQLITELGDIQMKIGPDKESAIMDKNVTPFLKLFKRYMIFTTSSIPISFFFGTLNHGFGSKEGSGFDIDDEVALWSTSFYYTVFTIVGSVIGITMDFLPAGVYCCITMRLQMLQMFLKGLGSDKTLSVRDVSAQIKTGTQEFVKIQKLVLKAEKDFNGMIMAQTMLSGFTLSVTLIRLSKASFVENPVLFVGDSFFALVAVFVLWIAMNFANEIQYESDQLLTHVGNGDWINISTKNKKELIVLQEGMKRPLFIRCFKWLKLNLRVFTTIVKNSYKIYTIMRDVGN